METLIQKNRTWSFHLLFAGVTQSYLWQEGKWAPIRLEYPGQTKHLKMISPTQKPGDTTVRRVPFLQNLFPQAAYLAGIPGPIGKPWRPWLIIESENPIFSSPRKLSKVQKFLHRAWSKYLQEVNGRREKELQEAQIENSALTALAHQIKSPLAGLEASLAQFQGTLDVDSIRGRISKTREFIKDFLWLRKIQTQSLLPMEINACLDQVRAYYQHDSRLAPGALAIVQDRKSAWIQGHAAILFHVFHNLIENAVNAVGTNVKMTIEVNTLSENASGNIQIKLTDNGPGIPPDICKNLFTSGGQSTSRGGWGLFICRKIMEYHNGKISYQPPTGSCPGHFLLQFPSGEIQW